MIGGVRWHRDDYALAANKLAPALLGQYLVHETSQGVLVGRIVETEAYGGTYRRQGDDGSHAFRGLTARTEPMFRRGGYSYVYLIYGMYCCMNVVAGPAGDGQAVLIRAVEPIAGTGIMVANRGLDKVMPMVSNGPGKVCMAMGISREQNGIDLCEGPLYIVKPEARRRFHISRSKRINIAYAVNGKEFPWRFYIEDSPYVSKA